MGGWGRYIFLSGKQAFPEPLRPLSVSLQTHPNIVDIPLHPQSDPTNDGWETKQIKPVLVNEKWTITHENHPQLKIVVASIAPYSDSFAQNHPLKLNPPL
jgi:hypothetical protein